VAEPALIERIRRQADLDIDVAWQKARAQADACSAESARALDDARLQAARRLAQTAAVLEADATARAETAARRIRAAASAALAARLHTIAVEALARFRTPEYPALFDALAGDLPARAWPLVMVHPDDHALAASHFPQAEIVCDPAIESGMVVEADEGRVRVTNTLRARLDAAWPDLLPLILRDARDAL
jgi:vacuolar-type H+-ATPase subunit E/Vma4